MEQSVENAVRQYLLAEFLPGEDPEELQDDTPLITGGILDSIATLKIVSFLESEFGIQVAAHEADADYLDSIKAIAELVRSKQQEGS